jgi:hypothetical protein
LVLSLVVVGGMIALDASTQGAMVSLELIPGRFAEAPIFRLFSSGGNGLELRFERGGRKERNELGTYAVRGGWKEGYLEFLEPGAVVKIQVQVGHDPNVYVFEAGPASGFNKEHIYRNFFPFFYDGDLQHYPWPPPSSRYFAVPSGNSVVHIRVLEVAELLRGESAVVVIPPPVGIKRVEAGYRLVAMFYALFDLGVGTSKNSMKSLDKRQFYGILCPWIRSSSSASKLISPRHLPVRCSIWNPLFMGSSPNR